MGENSSSGNGTGKLVAIAVAAGGVGVLGGSGLDVITDRTDRLIDAQIMSNVDKRFERIDTKLHEIVSTQQTLEPRLRFIIDACRRAEKSGRD